MVHMQRAGLTGDCRSRSRGFRISDSLQKGGPTGFQIELSFKPQEDTSVIQRQPFQYVHVRLSHPVLFDSCDARYRRMETILT